MQSVTRCKRFSQLPPGLAQYLSPTRPSPPSLCPQVLSDILESLVGAVYVDTGGQLDVVWAVTQVSSTSSRVQP